MSRKIGNFINEKCKLVLFREVVVSQDNLVPQESEVLLEEWDYQEDQAIREPKDNQSVYVYNYWFKLF